MKSLMKFSWKCWTLTPQQNMKAVENLEIETFAPKVENNTQTEIIEEIIKR